VALWATHRLLPLVREGTFAKDLATSRKAALKLYEFLRNDPRWLAPFPPELDIVVWTSRAQSAREASRLTQAVFHEAARDSIHLALANLPVVLFGEESREMTWDQSTATCLRACVMKPEHLDWMDRIWQAFSKAAQRVFT
jgi:hypothetical protein